MTSSLEIAATVVTLVSVALIGVMEISGQWLMLVSQAMWLAVALYSRMPGLAVQSVILALLTGNALVVWADKLGRWW